MFPATQSRTEGRQRGWATQLPVTHFLQLEPNLLKVSPKIAPAAGDHVYKGMGLRVTDHIQTMTDFNHVTIAQSYSWLVGRMHVFVY